MTFNELYKNLCVGILGKMEQEFIILFCVYIPMQTIKMRRIFLNV